MQTKSITAIETRPGVPEVDRIITIKEWCAAAGFSHSTGKKLLRDGDGPIITRLSPRRIGIRVRDYLAWADARSGKAHAA